MHGHTGVKKIVTAILWLQYTVHAMLYPMIQVLYPYTGAFQLPLYDTTGIAFVVTFHTCAV